MPLRIYSKHLDQPEEPVWRRLEENAGQTHLKRRQRRCKGHRHELTVHKYRCSTLTAAGNRHEGSSDRSELPVWRRLFTAPLVRRSRRRELWMAAVDGGEGADDSPGWREKNVQKMWDHLVHTGLNSHLHLHQCSSSFMKILLCVSSWQDIHRRTVKTDLRWRLKTDEQWPCKHVQSYCVWESTQGRTCD